MAPVGATVALHAPRQSSDAEAFGPSSSLWALAAVLALWVSLMLLNPVGYVGGGSDDARYLEAAQCVVAQGGWCTPSTHWSARWPTVAPLAGAIALLGETRTALGVASAPWAAAALLLLVALVRRWTSAVAAMLAGCVLALTPVFTLRSLSPNADLPELTFLLGAWLAASKGRPLVCGLLFGLAICTRETAAAALVILPIALLWKRLPPRSVGLGAFGLVLPVSAEAVFYGVTAGDPLLRLHLALAHTRIPSTELTTGVDRHLPILNFELVRHWKPASGIHVHWLLDPLLNLFANPLCGIVLLAALGLLTIRGRETAPVLRIAALGSASVSLILIFVLAIDPKPRMFLVAIAAAAAIVGSEAARRLAAREFLIPVTMLALIATKGAVTIADQFNLLRAEQIAASWLASAPPELVLPPNTKSLLALVPQARRFPTGTGTPRLSLETGVCAPAAVRSSFIREPDGPVIAAVRKTGMLLGPVERGSICLYR